MSSFQIVSSYNEISLSSEWGDSAKFECRGRIVDGRGREVSREYEGPRYRIIAKKEIPFSTLERIERAVFGILVIISTLCLALFLSSVRKLLTKPNKTIRYAIPDPPFPPSPHQQQEAVPPSTLFQKIAALFQKLEKLEKELAKKLGKKIGNGS